MQVVELTEVAKEFLSARFEEFDLDKDGILSPAEQDVMYSTSPSRCAGLELTSCKAVLCRNHRWL